MSERSPFRSVHVHRDAEPLRARAGQVRRTQFACRLSPVVRAGDWVYVSGMPPVNPETGGYDILPIDQQARRCWSI